MEVVLKKIIPEMDKLPIKIKLFLESFTEGRLGLEDLAEKLMLNDGVNPITKKFVIDNMDELAKKNRIGSVTIDRIERLMDDGDLLFLKRDNKKVPIKTNLISPALSAKENTPILNTQEISQPPAPTKTKTNESGVEEEKCLRAIVGESKAIKELIRDIRASAGFKMSRKVILIEGENGSGKELVSKALWSLGLRKNKPFVIVNCATISEGLLESELFGHRKGSFTGAINDHLGHFLSADGGTVFLDEIGELSLETQAKLLRLLQNGEIQPVGGSQKNIDIEIIAATNRNLKNEIQKGNFREDLYYRLNFIRIQVPPLRERREDIGLLAEYFLNIHKKENGLSSLRFKEKALTSLMLRDWPGNIRELQGFIAQQVIKAIKTSNNVIDIDDTEPQDVENALLEIISSKGLDGIMSLMEKHILTYAIFLCDGKVADASEVLKRNRTNLHRVIAKHKVTRSTNIDPRKISLLIKFLS